MSYKKQLDWLVILLDAFWLALTYFLKGGEAKRCRVECDAVLNSLATFPILRLVFLVEVCERCESVLFNSEGSSLPRIFWKVFAGFDRKKREVFVFNWFTDQLQLSLLSGLYIVTNSLGKLDWKITEKEAKVKVDLSQKAGLIHREIFLRLA